MLHLLRLRPSHARPTSSPRGGPPMPRRWKAAIFLTTLLAATLSLATFASARTDHVTVLHFTARQVELHFVDVAPTGGPPSPVPCAPSTTGRVPLRGHRPPGPGRPDRPRLGLPAADQRLWDHRGHRPLAQRGRPGGRPGRPPTHLPDHRVRQRPGARAQLDPAATSPHPKRAGARVDADSWPSGGARTAGATRPPSRPATYPHPPVRRPGRCQRLCTAGNRIRRQGAAGSVSPVVSRGPPDHNLLTDGAHAAGRHSTHLW